jgi:hypothetical protein
MGAIKGKGRFQRAAQSTEAARIMLSWQRGREVA